MSLSEINIFAIILATIAAFSVGAVWYGPLFGKKWMQLTGTTEKDIKDCNVTATMALGALNTLVMVVAIALLMQLGGEFGSENCPFYIVFIAILGFSGTVLAEGCLWERKPFGLLLINFSHKLVIALVATAILYNWPW